jgi:putative FmdB family regulatory protein
MPVYEYGCPEGHEKFEKLSPMSVGSAKVDCPECGTPSARVISMFSAKVAAGSDTFSAPSGASCACGGGCGC